MKDIVSRTLDDVIRRMAEGGSNSRAYEREEERLGERGATRSDATRIGLGGR